LFESAIDLVGFHLNHFKERNIHIFCHKELALLQLLDKMKVIVWWWLKAMSQNLT